VIYTRFVHRGGGKIANPIPGETSSKVQIHLAGARVVRYQPGQQAYWYQVSVQLRDAKGTVLWSGEMYGDWSIVSKRGRVHMARPNDLDKPLPTGWKEP
jgi:hypothetical protein